jgi:SHS2 domain-containing protein
VSARSRPEEHVGEWKLTLRGDTLASLFVEAARVIARSGGRARGDAGPWEPVSLSATDQSTLLVDWLNELIGRSEVERRAYGEVRDMRIADTRLEAEVRGTPVAEWCSPVKAATYHGLRVEGENGRWTAVVLLDV